MEWYEVGLGLLGLLILLDRDGSAHSLRAGGGVAAVPVADQSFQTSLVSSQLKLWGVWINYILLAVPLFVFLGELIGRSNIGPRLYQFLHQGGAGAGLGRLWLDRGLAPGSARSRARPWWGR